MIRKILFSALGLGALASNASANAFNINEHDARVTGRAGATAASNTEPSSVVFNPGGIALNEGTNIALGTAFYFAQGTYEADGGEKQKTDSGMAVVPNLYVTSRLHEMVAVGIGLHFPFGLAVSWPSGHPQADVIQDQTLRTYFITLGAGLNLNKQVPGLSVGAGFDIVPATIELENSVGFGEVQGTAHLGGDAVGFGGRVGAMYHSPDVRGLKVGVMYRSPVKLDFEGKGDFDIEDPYRSQLPPDGTINATITLPQSVWGGVAYSPIPDLDIEYNAVWINWAQAFEDGNLTIDLPDDGNPATPRPQTVSPQDYKNTVTHRLGAEYRLPAHGAAIRAGLMYDPTPIPTTTLSARLPDINRFNITLGGSYAITPEYGVHLGLLWVTPGERETSDKMYEPQFKGTYGVQAFVANLGVSGKFGK
ncbi:MAG: outer membrane protein transport protein [Myxococcota bacterium]|nr:outer membrane protein transport protein [Deltaproteobacteria bacterium]MDQ3337289.1 outer membrane protein transport protein [Myxococcota bacterium]